MKTRLALDAVCMLYFQICDAREDNADFNQPLVLESPPASVYGFRAEQVADGVYTLNQGDEFHIQPRGNVGVIEQSNGVVLIDSGGSPDGAEQVIALVRSMTGKPVTAIVITHWHGDHALGVSRLLEEWPQARVISTKPTRDMLGSVDANRFMPGDDAAANAVYLANIEAGVSYLRDASKDDALAAEERAGFSRAASEYEQFGREMALARRVAPSEVFERSMMLSDTTHPVELMFPGRANTAGDAVAWLPRQKIVFTGDVVVVPIPYGFNAYPESWITVLENIRGLGYRVLVPGHGRPMQNEVGIDMLISMLKDVRAQVAPMAATDMDAAAVSAGIDLEAQGQSITAGDRWLQRWFRDYWKLPIVSSALREARGEPVVQGAN
jgi:glyoxylase-like metal-dependent hydrolase (beta-lactamase superfamily II)